MERLISWRNRQLKLASVGILFFFCVGTASAHCRSPQCTLATTQGAYPDFIIGTLVHIATTAELKQTFRWAKAQGYWQQLPASFPPYAHNVMVATLQPSPQRQMTVFIMRAEYQAAPLRVGDLVRYRPHDEAHDAPNDTLARRLFYGLTGCIATLCSNGNTRCLHHFTKGVFTLDGNQVNPATGKQIAGGIHINPVSLQPLHAASQAGRRPASIQ